MGQRWGNRREGKCQHALAGSTSPEELEGSGPPPSVRLGKVALCLKVAWWPVGSVGQEGLMAARPQGASRLSSRGGTRAAAAPCLSCQPRGSLRLDPQSSSGAPCTTGYLLKAMERAGWQAALVLPGTWHPRPAGSKTGQRGGCLLTKVPPSVKGVTSDQVTLPSSLWNLLALPCHSCKLGRPASSRGMVQNTGLLG